MGERLRIIGERMRRFSFRESLIFVFFLVLASLIWYGHAMNSVRSAKLPVTVVYKGIPEEILFSDTLPEVIVRKMLWANGYRFRVCDRRIVGHPDIVIPKCRALVEIRGCFWHQHGWEWDGRKLVQTSVCATATRPKSNRAFWNAKFRRNVRRDAEHEKAWAAEGWNLIVIWECGLKTAKEREKTFAFVLRNLSEWGKKV